MSRLCVFLPAALDSYGLLLREHQGKTLLQHTWDQVQESLAYAASRVIVVTPDPAVGQIVASWGGEVCRVPETVNTPLAMVREGVLRAEGGYPLGPEYHWIGSLDPWEVEIPSTVYNDLRLSINEHPWAEAAVAIAPLAKWGNQIRAAVSRGGNLLYLTRQPLPGALRLVGAALYQRSMLMKDWWIAPRGPLERLEQLEQLRWLENDLRICVARLEEPLLRIENREDWKCWVVKEGERVATC